MTEYFGTKVENIFNTMPERFRPDGVKDIDVSVAYDIAGEGGGKWVVTIKEGILNVEKIEGDIPDCSVVLSANAETFVGGTLGKVDLSEAMSSGKFKVNGDMSIITAILPAAFNKFGTADQENQAEELIFLKVVNSIDCRFASGPHMGKWFQGLKEKKFYATKCPSCGRTQLPPREVCAVCVIRSDDFIEVGPTATVNNIDLVYYASPDPLTGHVRSTPYVTLYLWMEGSTPSECLSFELSPRDIDRIKIGMKVRPVWNEVRTGGIHDLLYFEIDD